MVMLAVDRADRTSLASKKQEFYCVAAIMPTAPCRPLVHHVCVGDSMVSCSPCLHGIGTLPLADPNC